MLIHSAKPLLVILLYLPNALQNHTHFGHQDVNDFLNLIITLANHSNWDIICGGDFNCFPLDEILVQTTLTSMVPPFLLSTLNLNN
jgi:hypothetical protein